MHKFRVGQLVILARPEITMDMKNALGCITKLPGETKGIWSERYTVAYPDFPHRMGCEYMSAEHMLDPIDDSDNRTKADESELVFRPKVNAGNQR